MSRADRVLPEVLDIASVPAVRRGDQHLLHLGQLGIDSYVRSAKPILLRIGLESSRSLKHLTRGRRLLLFTGSSPERIAPLIDELASSVAGHVVVGHEPSLDDLRASVDVGRRLRVNAVTSIGGGSAMDIAKGTAALLANAGDALDYLEAPGRLAAPLTRLPLWHLAVPTTAGTGAEVTRNAVFSSRELNAKASIRSPALAPDVAVVDPLLMSSCPATVVASSGMDALVHLLESMISRRATPNSQRISLVGIRLVMQSLRTAYADSNDHASWGKMSKAATLGGFALTEAGLGIVHGIAAPLGAVIDAPHGSICAATVTAAMRTNFSRILAGVAESRLVDVGRLCEAVCGAPDATSRDALEALAALVHDLQCPPLKELGLRGDQIRSVALAAGQSSSTKANPVTLSDGEVEEIIRMS